MDIRKEISAALVDGFAIRFIAFPLEETHLSAVKQDRLAIQYIKNHRNEFVWLR